MNDEEAGEWSSNKFTCRGVLGGVRPASFSFLVAEGGPNIASLRLLLLLRGFEVLSLELLGFEGLSLELLVLLESILERPEVAAVLLRPVLVVFLGMDEQGVDAFERDGGRAKSTRFVVLLKRAPPLHPSPTVRQFNLPFMLQLL
jgi:hypothetical protein